MTNAASIVPAKGLESAPQYELRVRRYGPVDTEYAIWQIPSSATPHLTFARGVARLRGSNLDLIEHRVLRRLAQSGVRLGPNAGDENGGYPLPEEVALLLGLPVPRSCADEKPRQHACRSRGHRDHAPRGSSLLGWNGNTPPASASRADGAAHPLDRRRDKIGWRSIGGPPRFGPSREGSVTWEFNPRSTEWRSYRNGRDTSLR